MNGVTRIALFSSLVVLSLNFADVGRCDLATNLYSHSCCVIQNSAHKSGSGFLCTVARQDSSDRVYVVTNNHMLPEESSSWLQIRIHVANPNDTISWIRLAIRNTSGTLVTSVKVHPSADVACVDVTDTLLSRGFNARWIGDSCFASDNTLRQGPLDLATMPSFWVTHPVCTMSELLFRL